MISIVVATRNRAYTLRKVLDSYYTQECVDELVIVSDGSTDNTVDVVGEARGHYPEVTTVLVANSTSKGAPASRNLGVAAASNHYVLFCDDDEYLEPGYAATCLDILRSERAAIVSGRRIYLQPGERPADALARFGSGYSHAPVLLRRLCYLNGAAHFTGEVESPLVSPVMLTRTKVALETPFDEHYGQGNGYREETDFQLAVYLSGQRVVMSDRVHSFHLPMSEVRTGGQRASRLVRITGMISYTHYLYDKYYDDYANRVGLSTPRWLADAYFSWFAVYKVALRPVLDRCIGVLHSVRTR